MVLTKPDSLPFIPLPTNCSVIPPVFYRLILGRGFRHHFWVDEPKSTQLVLLPFPPSSPGGIARKPPRGVSQIIVSEWNSDSLPHLVPSVPSS